MKRFSNYVNENSVTSDVNPGNLYPNTGVTNHLTPVGNIVASIRNFWSPLTGVVASIGEDGFSVKLNSSKFVSQEAANDILYNSEIMRGTCLYSYIMQQGLPVMKCIPIGQYFVIYFCPNDIKAADKKVKEGDVKESLVCQEMVDNDIDEVEMISLVRESDDEEEIKDLDREKILEIIKEKDKVKAAKQLEQFVTSKIELPREYYFAGVKSKEGDESIALRWKFTKKRPHNKTIEVIRSIMNILDDSKEGIWVQDFDEEGLVKLPEEVETLIHSILDMLGASETDKPYIWSLAEADKKEEKKEDENDDDKSDDNNDKSNDEEDTEDDKSRGDDDDLLK